MMMAYRLVLQTVAADLKVVEDGLGCFLRQVRWDGEDSIPTLEKVPQLPAASAYPQQWRQFQGLGTTMAWFLRRWCWKMGQTRLQAQTVGQQSVAATEMATESTLDQISIPDVL
jgi:hypothetical protein